jgi:hypothetical protein
MADGRRTRQNPRAGGFLDACSAREPSPLKRDHDASGSGWQMCSAPGRRAERQFCVKLRGRGRQCEALSSGHC